MSSVNLPPPVSVIYKDTANGHGMSGTVVGGEEIWVMGLSAYLYPLVLLGQTSVFAVLSELS